MTTISAKPGEGGLFEQKLERLIGREVGCSRWTQLPQMRVNSFADATEDWQFIHVDPRAAQKTAFGGTIVHGFLLLSLLSTWSYEVFSDLNGAAIAMNYGFDRIRFIAPVRTGMLARGRFVLEEYTRRNEQDLLLRYAVSVEAADSEESDPVTAIAAKWLVLYRTGAAEQALGVAGQSCVGS